MPKGFDLTANLHIAQVNNLGNIVSSIKKKISGVNGTINLSIKSSTAKNVDSLNVKLDLLSSRLLTVSKSSKVAQSSLDSLSSTFNKFNNPGLTKGIESKARALDTIKKSAADTGGQLEKFGRQASQSLRRFGAFTVATTAFFKLAGAISGAIDEAIDFQDQMVKISQVSNQTLAQLGSLDAEVTRLSVGLGVSSKELLRISQVLKQAGVSTDDTRTALESLAKTSLAPTFKNLDNTTEGVIASMSQFKIKAEDLEGVLGSLNAVSAQFAVESEDLVSVIRKAGGSFASASRGLGAPQEQLRELIALFTSVRATTRENAEGIASGLNTIFARIQRPRTIEYLKQFNIELERGGRFVGAFDAIRQISKAIETIPDRSIVLAQIVEEIGGFRQAKNVIPLINEFETAVSALSAAERGQTSLNRDVEISQQSLAVQIAKTRENFLSLIRDISKTSTFNVAIKTALSFADALINITRALKELVPLIAAVGAVKIFQGARPFAKGFFSDFTGRASGVARKASGGFINSGQGGVDDVPALLMKGEYVLNRNAVGKIGVSNLNKLNSGKIARFAKGGFTGGKADLIERDVVKGLSGSDIQQLINVTSQVPQSIRDMVTEYSTVLRDSNNRIIDILVKVDNDLVGIRQLAGTNLSIQQKNIAANIPQTGRVLPNQIGSKPLGNLPFDYSFELAKELDENGQKLAEQTAKRIISSTQKIISGTNSGGYNLAPTSTRPIRGNVLTQYGVAGPGARANDLAATVSSADNILPIPTGGPGTRSLNFGTLNATNQVKVLSFLEKQSKELGVSFVEVSSNINEFSRVVLNARNQIQGVLFSPGNINTANPVGRISRGPDNSNPIGPSFNKRGTPEERRIALGLALRQRRQNNSIRELVKGIPLSPVVQRPNTPSTSVNVRPKQRFSTPYIPVPPNVTPYDLQRTQGPQTFDNFVVNTLGRAKGNYNPYTLGKTGLEAEVEAELNRRSGPYLGPGGKPPSITKAEKLESRLAAIRRGQAKERAKKPSFLSRIKSGEIGGNTLQRIQFGSFAAATAASFVTPKTATGTGAQGAVIGGATGLGLGASVGLTNPFGLALVAATTATVGFVTSLDEFNKQKSLEKLTQDVKNVSDNFEELSKNNTKSTRERFGSSSSIAVGSAFTGKRQDLSSVSSQTSRLVNFLNPFESGYDVSKVAKGVIEKANFEVSQQLSEVGQANISAVKGRLINKKDLSQEQKVAIALQNSDFIAAANQSRRGLQNFSNTDQGKRFIDFIIENTPVDKLFPALDLLARNIDDTAKRMSVLSQQVEIVNEDFQAQNDVQSNFIDLLSGNFSIANSQDTGALSRRISRLDALSPDGIREFGGRVSGVSPDVVNSIAEAKQVGDAIADVLKGIDFNKFNDVNQVEDRLFDELRGRGINPQTKIVADLLNSLGDQLNSAKQNNPQIKAEEFLNQNFVTQFGDAIKAQTELLQTAAKAQEEKQRTLLANQDRYARAIQSGTDKLVQVQNLRAENELKLIELNGGSPTLNQLNKPFDKTLTSLTGGVTSPQGIFQQIQRFADAIKGGDASPENVARLNNFNRALELLTNDTTKFSNSLRKADEAVKKRGAIEDFTFKALGETNPVEVFKQAQAFNLAGQVNKGDVSGLNRLNLPNFLQNVPQITELITTLQGEKAGQTFKRNALIGGLQARGIANTPFGKELVASLDKFTKEEELAKNAAKEALNTQLKAAELQLQAANLQIQATGKLPGVGRNNGGIIPGGGPNRDSVMAALTPGEFVVNREATRANIGTLRAINSGRGRRAYNTGGFVNGGGFNIGGIETLSRALISFGQYADKLANLNIPERITIEIAPLQVNATISGETQLTKYIAEGVLSQLRGVIQEQIKGIINPLNGETRDAFSA